MSRLEPGGRLPIDERSTFIITNGVGINARLTPQPGGSGHGTQHLLVQNHESSQWAGLAQEGKFFRKGETYEFRGRFRSVSGSSKAELRFYATGDWSRPIAVLPLKEFGTEWSERKVSFRNTRHAGSPVIGCSGRLWSSDLFDFVLVVFMVFFFDLVLGPVYRPSPVLKPAHQGGRREESPEGTAFGPPDEEAGG